MCRVLIRIQQLNSFGWSYFRCANCFFLSWWDLLHIYNYKISHWSVKILSNWGEGYHTTSQGHRFCRISTENASSSCLPNVMPQTSFFTWQQMNREEAIFRLFGLHPLAHRPAPDESPHWQRLQKQDEEKPQAVSGLRTEDNKGHHAVCHLVVSFVL